jgi:uncharacterized membrane protein YgdD (TMEM256/DUF423 family)
MARLFFVLAGVAGFSGVALGAFGAHGLRERLLAAEDGVRRLEIWETAARYHLIHALALALAAELVLRAPGRAAVLAGWLFAVGIVIFSGSLYALSLTNLRVLGAVTPFGGLCFLAAWVAVVVAALQLE